ncbi:tyrosine-type recombinase/integrase [Oceanidesulfovibrio marinus]|uniref:Site-specific integrase n=1 Tax=Oceanidesulfovibrio marinus TaxID=370038 RepID=A0A6P1ZFL2_9BACT|nr:site-specific integrase [Oceanidesulfovibrio marinus]TVM31602.1 site-specific integrase [Oceanidesulfovibrio marinus]
MSVHQYGNGTWYVKWWDSREQHQRSKCFGKGPAKGPEHKDALAFDADIKAKKARGQSVALLPRPSEVVTLDTLAQAYVDRKKAEGKLRQWLVDWVRVMNDVIVPMFDMTPVDDLTLHDMLSVASHYKDLGRSQSTINRYMSYLKMMFNFGLKEKLISNNPLAEWRKSYEPPKEVNLTVEDLKRILAVAPDHLAWSIEVAYNLALRVGASELFALRWQNVNWERGEVRIFMPKTGRWKHVPCSEAFLAKLRARQAVAQSDFVIEYKGRPVKQIKTAWKTAIARAGLPYKPRPYDVRHLAITELFSRGVDPGAVSEIAGHTSAAFTISRYHHVRNEAKKRAISQLPAL